MHTLFLSGTCKVAGSLSHPLHERTHVILKDVGKGVGKHSLSGTHAMRQNNEIWWERAR